MASKVTLNQKIEALELQVEEANDRARRLAIDNDAHRARERARTRVEHAEKQRKLKEGERAARLERLKHISSGLLPLQGTTEWTIKSNDRQQLSVEVSVPLSGPEYRALQDYVDGRREHEAKQDAINKMRENADRISRHYFGISPAVATLRYI